MKLQSKVLLVCLILSSAFMLYGCTGSNNWAVPQAASNLPPTAMITAPLDGFISDEGDPVTFTGEGQDSEDGVLSGGSLVWTSNMDGQIGTGLTFDITTLSRNTHVITLTATDATGATGTASIVVTIRTPWLDIPGWGNRQMIIIDESMIPDNGGLTDFPALVKITNQTNPLFDSALPNGDDILFTDMDGVNQLDHEIELYMDTVLKELYAWVRIPLLSSTSDTIIYMYYGNAGAANQENPTGVWDSNYLGVWHMAEDPSTDTDGDCGGGTKEMCDSTINDVDGDSGGGMTSGDLVPGQVDGSLDFDGSNDYIDVGGSADPADYCDTPTNSNCITLLDNFTVEAWFNTRSIPPTKLPAEPEVHWRNIIGQRWLWHFEITDADYFGSGPRVMFRRWGYPTYMSIISQTTISTDQWYYAAFTVTTNDLVLPCSPNWRACFPWDNYNGKLYLNGLLDAERAIVTPFNYNYDRPLRIARREADDIDWFDGPIDEMRISDTVRSPEWIQATYKTQNDPGTGVGGAPDVYTTFAIEEVE